MFSLVLLLRLLPPLLCIISGAVTSENFDDILSHLHSYGYLNFTSDLNYETINETSDKYIQALRTFQKQYNLPADDELNAKTLELMRHRRCGNRDLINYNVGYSNKWTNKTVTWEVYRLIDTRIVDLIQKAFEIWSKNADIKFMRADVTPDISISFGKTRHFCAKSFKVCSNSFDGIGGVLAHADLPNINQAPVEIHFDADEKWDYAMQESSNTHINFFEVVVHEIGHALGIYHSFNPDAIMYAYYKPKMFHNSHKQHLDIPDDDKHAIQALYGASITTTTTAPVQEATTSEQPPPPLPPNICTLNNDLDTFLVVNENLYIFYKNWVWRKNLIDNSFDYKPSKITDWLKFLVNFSQITAIYQKPNGNIILIADSKIHNVNFPSLQLENYIKLDHVQNITGAFNSYTGHTYIFHSGLYCSEIDDCTNSVKDNSYVYKKFPEIPVGFKGAFRYTDGLLYFFKNKNYYAYSEFTQKLIKAGPFDLSVFDIECSNVNIFKQIKNVLNKIVFFYHM